MSTGSHLENNPEYNPENGYTQATPRGLRITCKSSQRKKHHRGDGFFSCSSNTFPASTPNPVRGRDMQLARPRLASIRERGFVTICDRVREAQVAVDRKRAGFSETRRCDPGGPRGGPRTGGKRMGRGCDVALGVVLFR